MRDSVGHCRKRFEALESDFLDEANELERSAETERRHVSKLFERYLRLLWTEKEIESALKDYGCCIHDYVAIVHHRFIRLITRLPRYRQHAVDIGKMFGSGRSRGYHTFLAGKIEHTIWEHDNRQPYEGDRWAEMTEKFHRIQSRFVYTETETIRRTDKSGMRRFAALEMLEKQAHDSRNLEWLSIKRSTEMRKMLAFNTPHTTEEQRIEFFAQNDPSIWYKYARHRYQGKRRVGKNPWNLLMSRLHIYCSERDIESPVTYLVGEDLNKLINEEELDVELANCA